MISHAVPREWSPIILGQQEGHSWWNLLTSSDVLIFFFCLQSLVDVDEGTRQGYDSMSPVVASTTVEGDDEEHPHAQEHHDENKPRERSPIETIFVYIMKQSYAASLIIMMVG